MSKKKYTTVFFEGIDDIIEKLDDNISAKIVPEIIKTNASEMNKSMQQQTTVKFTGYLKNGKLIKPTGATRRSITTDYDYNGWKSVTGATTEYSPYLIYGTRYMSKRDFFRPSYRVQRIKFKKDMQRLVE